MTSGLMKGLRSRGARRAFTLVELMISMVIGLVVALAAVSFNKVLSVSSKATSSVADVSTIFDSIQAILAVPETCTAALQNSVGIKPIIGAGSDLAKIVLTDGSMSPPTIAVGTKFGAFEVTAISWEDDGALGPFARAMEPQDQTRFHPQQTKAAEDAGAPSLGGKSPYWALGGASTTLRFVRLTIEARPLANAGMVGTAAAVMRRVYRFFIVSDNAAGNRMKECFKSWKDDEVIP